MYYIHDAKHILKYVSPQCYEMLGYTKEELMINWTKLATDNPINLNGFEVTERALKTGERQEEYLLELKKKDKETVKERWSLEALEEWGVGLLNL